MFDQTNSPQKSPEPTAAKNWIRVLAKYRDPSLLRSLFELGVTVAPFLLLWVLAWWSLGVSYWLTLFISICNGAFLVRLFAIQHDCGHGAFLKSRVASDWLGRVLGVLTLTPYDVWRRSHAIHHGAAGNLENRGIGDIYTMTVAEYRALSPMRRVQYRLYRNPFFLFGIVPFYLFFFQNRLPLGFTKIKSCWTSAMGTNVAILAAVGTLFYFGGLMPILLIFVPSTLLAATAGVWLFYVQHQFETTHWEHQENWQVHEAALHGSSHYVLPPVLQWLSANIGIHHVHHLYSRIPFYRLPEVLRDNVELAKSNRMTLRESFRNARLHLWDEDIKRLVPFSHVRLNAAV